MNRSSRAVVRVGAAAAALTVVSLTVVSLGCAAPAAAAGQERLLPRVGSTLIVQPASIGLVTGQELSWARFTVLDGCGRQLTLGSPGVDGAAAAVPLPAQGAGPGNWQVTWTAGRTDGGTAHGSWAFKVAEGTPCPGSAEADAAAAAAAAGISTGHHGGNASFAGGEAEVTSGSSRPGLALVAAAVGGLAISVLGFGLIRRQRRRGGVTLPEATAVVSFLALMLTLAGISGGGSMLARLALALPAAVLITGTVLSVVAELRLRLARALMSGWSAATATAILVGLWQAGRSRLMVIPGDEAYAALPLQAATVGLVVLVLAVGGWFGGRRLPDPSLP